MKRLRALSIAGLVCFAALSSCDSDNPLATDTPHDIFVRSDPPRDAAEEGHDAPPVSVELDASFTPAPPLEDASSAFDAHDSTAIRDGGVDSSDATVDAPTSTAVVLAAEQQSPTGIAVDDTHVYWTNRANAGAVMRVLKAGGATTPFVGGQAFPTAIVVDAMRAYWGSNGVVARTSLDAGPIAYVDFTGARSLAQDVGNIYWTTNVTDGVRQAPKDGGAPVVLAAGLTTPLGDVAVDATDVYWTLSAAAPDGLVMKTPIGGGALTTLATGQSSPTGIAVDATHVYWLNATNATLCKVPRAGGAVVTLANIQLSARSLLLDSGVLYWTTQTTAGSISKTPVTGGPITLIEGGQNMPGGLAVDATFVYWTNTGSGEIMRAPK